MAVDEAAAAEQYNAALRLLAARSVAGVVGAYAAVKAADIDRTFTAALPGILAELVRGQLYAATTSVAYHQRLLAAHGLTPSGPAIRPAGFAAGLQTADGRDLRSVVALAPIYAKQRIVQGMPAEQALDSGRTFLASVVQSETQDAARSVMDVALNTDDQYEGYLRVPDPDACGRCLILAGRVYRTDGDFLRHPRCLCSSQPVLRDNPPPDPPSARSLFDDLDEPAQDAAFGIDGAEAIRSGADPASVQNARQGMRAAGDTFTEQGTLSRKGQRRYPNGRLSPLGCRRQADGDQAKYLELLATNGYTQ